MAQCVWVCGVRRTFIEKSSNVASSKPSSAGVDEERGGRFLVDDFVTNRGPFSNRLERCACEGNPTLLRSLSPNGDHSPVRVDVRQIERTQFTDTQSTAVENFEHGIVTFDSPEWMPVFDIARFENVLKFGTVEYAWQPAFTGRSFQRHCRIRLDPTGSARPPKIPTKR
jgi:hypothetical protein